MAPKVKKAYFCKDCGHQEPKWLGQCPQCKEWSTMIEEPVTSSNGSGRAALVQRAVPKPLVKVEAESYARYDCGKGEFNRVLGGGLVPGSLVLVGGDPGIGKSTLILQTLDYLAQTLGTVLYVSAEESDSQVKLRADRLGVTTENLLMLPETCLERMSEHIHNLRPTAVVIDSIQTIYTEALESATGGVGQVRECTNRLMLLAKGLGVATFIIGHVTKEGAIAGPRVLEHMVDAVLYLEGDPGHPFRILRAVKNRFGSCNEIGVFEMKGEGMAEVTNPSELFLSERPIGEPGSVVLASLEGTRTMLVELQALVSKSPLGMPRRTTIGIDSQRTSLLLAVLEKKIGLSLSEHDVYLNVAGGLKLNEPGSDLALICSVASSYLERPLDAGTVIFGEVGLAGEVRNVSNPEARVREAEKMGFHTCILPEGSLKGVRSDTIHLVGVPSVQHALQELFGSAALVPKETEDKGRGKERTGSVRNYRSNER